jgi:hypothetical protein
VIKVFKNDEITYAEFYKGQMVNLVDKKQCRNLYDTDLDVNVFLKESKRRLNEFELFIKDQKLKIEFNYRNLKKKID